MWGFLSFFIGYDKGGTWVNIFVLIGGLRVKSFIVGMKTSEASEEFQAVATKVRIGGKEYVFVRVDAVRCNDGFHSVSGLMRAFMRYQTSFSVRAAVVSRWRRLAGGIKQLRRRKVL
jgi:hypothetical protein